MELADHHIFTAPEQLKEELKKNYHYITDVLANFNLRTQQELKLVCALHDPEKPEKYHSDKNL